MAENSNSNNLGLIFGLGVFAGYITSLLIPDKAQEKIKDVVTDDLMDIYMEARGRVMDELEQTKTSWDSLNKKKYAEIVKKSLATLIHDGKISESQIKTMQKYLENDFEVFQGKQKA